MRSEASKLLGVGVALAVTVPVPQALAGQDSRDEEEDCRSTLHVSGATVYDILSQFARCSRSPEELGPRPGLDALADRLVALAIADPDSEDTYPILIELLVAGRPRQPGGYVRYPGAWDALRRMYLGGQPCCTI